MSGWRGFGFEVVDLARRKQSNCKNRGGICDLFFANEVRFRTQIGVKAMRIVTWNCNGALRRKTEALDSLQADVAVIQECEDPGQSDPDYRTWAGNYLWAGDLKSKGIGIFARAGQSLEPLDWVNDNFRLFLAARVMGAIDLIGVWTQSAKPSGTAYIGQLWHYLMLNRDLIGEQTVVLGDFNSNPIWDRPRRKWNHSDCVRELANAGLRSLYHEAFDEEHGARSPVRAR